LGNLSIPLTVQKLQTALHVKAKENPGFRFYALYDKVHREDILRFAYIRCKANGGAAGVDAQAFEDIEAYGGDRWLGELALELREKRYRPQAVRRVFIPKRNAGLRPLREKVQMVVRDEHSFGVLSTGERIAVALVLNRHDLLQKAWGSMLEAVNRLGVDWTQAALRVQRNGSHNGWQDEP
jgi:hypothetical protein